MSKYRDYWKELIGEVRSVYSGKITYAAEGLNAKNITFWSELDFIGIDAYFKLTDKENPELNEILNGWNSYRKELKNLYRRYNRKIIFTEIGYKSVDGTTIKPWEWKKDKRINQEQQARAFEAFFRVFSKADYFVDFFMWKYFTDNESYEKNNIAGGLHPTTKWQRG